MLFIRMRYTLEKEKGEDDGRGGFERKCGCLALTGEPMPAEVQRVVECLAEPANGEIHQADADR